MLPALAAWPALSLAGILRAEARNPDVSRNDWAVDPGLSLGAAKALRALFDRKVDVVDPEWVAPHVRRGIAERGIVLYDPHGKG